MNNNRHWGRVLAITLLCVCAGAGNVRAQSFEEYGQRIMSEFDSYAKKIDDAYGQYRDRINAEFADYLRQTWPQYESQPAQPVPDSPEPPRPVVKDPDVQPSDDPLPFDRVAPAPEPVAPPKPVLPLPETQPQTPDAPALEFVFYGAECRVPLEERHQFRLAGISENDVADGWQMLSAQSYLPVISECLAWRDRLHLCDWGYVNFVERMCTSFFPAQQNEARLMQMYILTQSGYKVRIGRADNNLVLLLPSKETIYEYPYIDINGVNYYITDPSMGRSSLYVHNREFPKEQFFSLQLGELPQLPLAMAPSRHLASKLDAGVEAEVAVNRNLIRFYNDYPLSSNWDIYAKASLSSEVKKQLYPALARSIAGKTRPEAANVLLHFVQTAFDYQTDEEQFGSERALFGDETFFYPYSDCEDRAILYAILVRELLGLDAVLLHYPGHLAAAVCFESEIAGDHLYVDSKRYTVCDPTYINANVGQAMPQYKTTPATVVKIR